MDIYRNIKKASLADARVEGDLEESLDGKKVSRAKIVGNFLWRKKFLVIGFLVIVVSGYGVYERYFSLTDAERAEKELSTAVAAVSKLIILPQGDEPVLATVTDAEALIAQQAFFAGAVNGDQLLLFPKNLKAVIYSPSRNVIVNAGPIEQDAKSVVEDGEPPASLPAQSGLNEQNALTIEVRNGTAKAGYALQIAEKLAASAGFTITKVTDASKNSYRNTVVFARTNKESEQSKTEALVSALDASVIGSLPEGEKDTEADVLVILGKE